MKRIVVCCDGTWSQPTQDIPTNVVKTARAVLPTAPDGMAEYGPQNLVDYLEREERERRSGDGDTARS